MRGLLVILHSAWRGIPSPWVWLLSVAGLAIGSVLWPLVTLDYPYTHSIGSNSLWAYQFGKQVLAGQLYPRWLEESFASMGSPTFVFYPPICMWAVVPFAALRWPVIDQLIGSIGLAVACMAVGAGGAARAFFPGLFWVQGICIGLAVLSPYFLINIFVRGAMGEMWAMVWLVWILWGFQMRWTGPQAWRLLPLSVSICLLALSHLPSLLLFVLTWIPLPILLIQIPKAWDPLSVLKEILGQLWSGIWKLYLPMGLGLGLASFFLLPPIFDQHLINIGFIAIDYPSQRLFVDGILNGFPLLTDRLFDRELLWIFGLTSGTGLGVLMLNLIGSKAENYRIQTRVFLWGTLLPSVMMTDLGLGLYTLIGSLERIQFSWRWLAISSICWPFLVGTFVAVLPCSRWPILRWSVRILVTAGLLIILFLSTDQVWESAYPWPYKADQLNQFFHDRPQFPQESDLTAEPYETVDFALLRNGLGQPFMSDVSEYTPIWASGPPHLPKRNYGLIEWQTGAGEISDLEWKYGFRRFRVNAFRSSQMLLRMHRWPGWQVRVGDQVMEAGDHNQDGRLRITVPPDETWVEVRYVGSKAEHWGWGISGVTLISLGVILKGHRRLIRLLGVQS